jgi:heme A synthase
LYHFYPFVLLACLGLGEYDRRFSKALSALLVIGANLYGFFVLGVLSGEFAYRYNVHKYVAVFHAGLLLLLLATTLWSQNSGKKESQALRSVGSPTADG